MSTFALKISVEGPVTRSHYNNITKQALRKFGHERANEIGSKVTQFRDQMANEKKNFKFRLFTDGVKYVSFTVTGGFRIFKTKYKIDDKDIIRYDWRNNFWTKVGQIIGYGIKIAKAICHFVPGGHVALPYLTILDGVNTLGRKMIKYDKPIPIQYAKPIWNLKEIKCKYFSNLHFYLISGCCQEKWCCWKCHDKSKYHKWVIAAYIECAVCGDKARQIYQPDKLNCLVCNFEYERPKSKRR